MPNQFLTQATAAMQMLDAQWFTPDTPTTWNGGSNFWKTPTICSEIIDYMTVAGSTDYVTTIENARLAGEPYIGDCGYYDDETCWGRMFMTAYFFFKNTPAYASKAPPYLTDATNIYTDLLGGWDSTCGGGVWWRRWPASYPGNTKAANATLGLMEISLGLYVATQQQEYLTQAQTCWNWIAEKNLVTGGLVIGGLNAQCLPDPNDGPVIALQGNPLGPLWSLYAATNDTSYLDIGQSIAEAAIRQMIWPTGVAWDASNAILQARPDADWNRQTQAYRQACSGDTPFKGIFVGFLGEFAKNLATLQVPARQQAAQCYAAVLAGNANALTTNFPGGAYGMDWHISQPNYQPDPDPNPDGDGINACLQYSALALFLAAAKTNPATEAAVPAQTVTP